jgi:signal peptidase II
MGPASQNNLKGRLTLFAVALVVFFLDQASKMMVQGRMALGESREVLGDLLRFTYILNPNGLMGLSFGPWTRYLLLPLSLAALAAIVYFYFRWQGKNLLAAVSLGMILAGAAGNLLDRFRQGAVVDFIDAEFPDISLAPFRLGPLNFGGYHLERWYTFNLADSAVLTGVAILLVITLREERRARPEKDPQP